MPPVTNTEHVERLFLYKKGWNDTQIANARHYCPQAIRYWRLQHKLPPNKYRGLSPKMEKQRMELYLAGYSDYKIAKAQGVTKYAVTGWRMRKDLPANIRGLENAVD